MNALIDTIPALLFVGVYAFYGLYPATAVLIAACIALVIYTWVRTRRMPKMQLAIAVVVTVLGGLTLWLHDPDFVKFKPTAIYAAFGAALLSSHFFGDKVLLARLPQQMIVMPDAVWRRVNAAWGIYYLLLAAVNFYIAKNFSEATWVTWKFISFTVLPFVFLLLHAPFLSRYLVTEPNHDDAH
ncbi:MAG: septation protein IspZ [Nevskia sp.]|jgi:intracellular septation protein|nr:septation protein IspZ [Nevskia sp.]MCK9386241.1 septation protein IspZ [Nevskia sp.]